MHSVQNFAPANYLSKLCEATSSCKLQECRPNAAQSAATYDLLHLQQPATYSCFLKLPSFHFLLLTPTPARTSPGPLPPPQMAGKFSFTFIIPKEQRHKMSKNFCISAAEQTRQREGGKEREGGGGSGNLVKICLA